MKTSQIVIALAAMVAMVFAITFAMNYLGDAPSAKGPTFQAPAGLDEKSPRVVFQNTRFPIGEGTAREWEHKEPGHADYGFENKFDVPILMGVNPKNCKCSNVELFMVSPELKARRIQRETVVRYGMFAGSAAVAYHLKEERDMSKVEDSLPRYQLLNSADGYPVPPKTVGWVRLSWTAETENNQVISAEMWMNDKNGGTGATLEALLVFVPALRLEKSVETIGDITPGNLPLQRSIICVSPTRENLPFKVEVVTPQALEGSDPVAAGPPVKLSRAECDEIQGKTREGSVMSAYRIPITLKDRVGDQPFATGPIRRLIRLVPADAGLDALTVRLVGNLESGVQVRARDDRGRIYIPTFDGAAGATRTVTLSAEVEGTVLELDRKRMPDYLDAQLAAPVKSASGRQTWKLTVTVLPKKANGVFPRDDDPAYRDSALYVKVLAPTPSLVRIPVEGNAGIR